MKVEHDLAIVDEQEPGKETEENAVEEPVTDLAQNLQELDLDEFVKTDSDEDQNQELNSVSDELPGSETELVQVEWTWRIDAKLK